MMSLQKMLRKDTTIRKGMAILFYVPSEPSSVASRGAMDSATSAVVYCSVEVHTAVHRAGARRPDHVVPKEKH